MNEHESENRPGDSGYDAATLAGAAIVLIGFALLVWFLPSIMLAIGGGNPVLAGLAIAVVLVLPFAGLWLRGRSRRKNFRR